jgi:hypothetical protein
MGTSVPASQRGVRPSFRLARLLLDLLPHAFHCEISMLYVVELDGRPWWNSTSIDAAKALAAPYIQHGRQVVIRSHELQREKVTLAYDHSQGLWVEACVAV